MDAIDVSAREMIRKDGHLEGCQVVIKVSGDMVVLTGKVYSFYQKSLAQTFVLRLFDERGVSSYRIENRLEVAGYDSSDGNGNSRHDRL